MAGGAGLFLLRKLNTSLSPVPTPAVVGLLDLPSDAAAESSCFVGWRSISASLRRPEEGVSSSYGGMPWSFVSLMTTARAATAVFILSAMLITLSVVAPLTAQHGPVAGLLLTAVAMSAITAAACSAATATQLASASPPSKETEAVVAPVHQGKGVSRASASASMLEPNADLQGTWIKVRTDQWSL